MPRLLLDTHIVLALLRRDFDQQFPAISKRFAAGDVSGFVSVATLWEIAIKNRLGKLETGIPLPEIPANLRSGSLEILGIEVAHVLHPLDPEPPTRDPFDRLLLAQCHVEGLRLVTVDRALVDHPLAFRT
ncbi:twitching motility protein PilT [Rhizobium sp. Root274]|uniref:type II toxin-antitoxin system VapC family toxin n=1 Tax=unclassified Rhizobium TaxID=2613769 RepID=UPI0007134958|nr:MULTISPECIES: type II toxin-antitoxin system VapC family toxin [unclassified Rhizobium]KQW28949.1 twitching motility protein PilT [Rhizobium sp. Root1240]KRD29145.1 twitching motility protein PilT [Rhizobium sp. Root274]